MANGSVDTPNNRVAPNGLNGGSRDNTIEVSQSWLDYVRDMTERDRLRAEGYAQQALRIRDMFASTEQGSANDMFATPPISNQRFGRLTDEWLQVDTPEQDDGLYGLFKLITLSGGVHEQFVGVFSSEANAYDKRKELCQSLTPDEATAYIVKSIGEIDG